MIALTDEMLLYHASYTEIQNINLAFCKKGLDFGQGFYTTSSYQQAYGYVLQAVKKHNFQMRSTEAPMRIEDGIKSLEFIRSERYGDIREPND